LFAKKNKGTYVLRIEDTDQKRFVPGAVENLIKVLSLFGINHEEGPTLDGSEIGNFGPYTQSKRSELYMKHALELVEKGKAYYCFCTPERLDELRKNQSAAGLPPMYDRHCANLSPEEVKQKIENGEKWVIRQKIPNQDIGYKDLIRGRIDFKSITLDDQVLIKSDGLPTYHLANVVDDHYMQITHVIRAEEWIPSTPKHIFLYEAFGWTPPEYAHLPLVLNKDRTKLSKRQGDVAIEDYLKKGYCIEALINFVAMLGWNPGKGSTEEMFSLKELEEIFTLENVHKAGAIFDLEKLNWFNYNWKKRLFDSEMRSFASQIDDQAEISIDNKKNLKIAFSLPEKEEEFKKKKGELLLNRSSEFIPEEMLENKDLLEKALSVCEDKVHKNVREIAKELGFFFSIPKYDTSLFVNEKMGTTLENSKTALLKAKQLLETIDLWTESTLGLTIIDTIKTLGLKNGQFLWPIRVALSGLPASPGVFESLWVLGKNESLKRIDEAIEKL
jgi:glutamyl-tRNA synthetase